MNDPRHPRHLTFSSWPPQLSSPHMPHKWLRFAFFCPKSLSSAVISLRSDLTQSGQIETTASSRQRVQRVLMTSNYWSQELESRARGQWEGRPLQGKQERRQGVKQSQLGSMPAVLCLFLPCSSSFDWSWDVCSRGVQYAAVFSPELRPCSSPGQPDGRPGQAGLWLSDPPRISPSSDLAKVL